jgi:hypothetical protein
VPVHFVSAFAHSSGPFDPDRALIAGVEVWGLPTSAPTADPNNPNFIYQRFQNGILMFDATSGTTAPLPMGEYLRALLSRQDLPADLTSEATGLPLGTLRR